MLAGFSEVLFTIQVYSPFRFGLGDQVDNQLNQLNLLCQTVKLSKNMLIYWLAIKT